MPIKSIQGVRLHTVTAIKLSGPKQEDPALTEFLKEFDAATVSNFFQPRMRIYKDAVGIEASKFNGRIHISSIMSFVQKGAGQAGEALKWMCALADKHKVVLDLTVSPIKNAGAREGKSLNKAQLTAWYKRNGFVTTRADAMERQPR